MKSYFFYKLQLSRLRDIGLDSYSQSKSYPPSAQQRVQYFKLIIEAFNIFFKKSFTSVGLRQSQAKLAIKRSFAFYLKVLIVFPFVQSQELSRKTWSAPNKDPFGPRMDLTSLADPLARRNYPVSSYKCRPNFTEICQFKMLCFFSRTFGVGPSYHGIFVKFR